MRLIMKSVALFALVMVWSSGFAPAAESGRDLLEQGRVHLRAGALSDAEREFRKAVELDPGLWAGWRELATTLRRRDKQEEAGRIVDNLLKIRPEDAGLHRDAGEIALARRRYNAARQHLERSLELRPMDVPTRMRLGEVLEAQELWDVALAQYDKVLELDPQRMPARIRQARILVSMDRSDLALKKLEQTRPGTPESSLILEKEIVRIYRRFGDQAYRDENYAEAQALYLEALKRDPGNSGLLANLGWVALRTGNTEQALEHWRGVIAAGAATVAVHRGMGDAYVELGEIDLAREAYRKVVASNPDDLAVRLKMAEIGFLTGDDATVRANHEALLSMAGTDEGWAARVAEQYLKHGRPLDGLKYLEGLEPGGISGRDQALARIHGSLLTAAYGEKRYREAAEHGLKALAVDPARLQVMRDLGWAYWQIGAWADVEKVWTGYADAYPQNSEPHGLLSRLYLRRRLYSKAVVTAEREVELDPGSRDARLRYVQALSGDTQDQTAAVLAHDLAAEHPDDLTVQLRYAEILTRLREPVAARDQWARILEMDPESSRALLRWIRASYNAGEVESAVARAERAVAVSPAPESILLFLKEDAEIRDDNGRAITWYRRLTKDYPERSRYWIDLSRKYIVARDPSSRLATVEQGLEVHPNRLDLQLEYANALVEVGRRRQALQIFENLVQAHPGNRVAYRGMVTTLLGLRRFDDALGVIDQDTNPFLNDQEPGFWRSAALDAMGEGSSAVEVLENIIDVPEGSAYVPMLLYHGLSPREHSLEVSIATLGEHLKALSEAGYETITLSELEAVMDGLAQLPDRPILVTFDDARTDSFEMADELLQRFGMKATMFVPTGVIGKNDTFYASWETMARFRRTGRWDLHAHGHRSHWPVPLDAEGGEGRFLTELAWIEDEGRTEAREEFEARLDDDYRLSLELMETNLGLRPSGFAFPFNELGQLAGGSETDAAFINERLYRKYFRFGMVQDSNGYNLIRPGDSDPRLMWRLSPDRLWTGADLLIRLAENEPVNSARLQLAKRELWSGRTEKARLAIADLGKDTRWFAAEIELALAEVALHSNRPREAQNHLDVRIASGGKPLYPGSGIARQLAWKNRPRVDFRLDSRSDSDSVDKRRAAIQFNLPLQAPVDLSLTAASIRYNEDDFGSLDGWNLTLDADGVLSRRFDGKVWIRQQSLRSISSTWAGGGDLRFRNDRHRFWAGLSREEMETVEALLGENGANSGRVGYAVSGSAWKLWSQAQLRDVDDGNLLSYLRGSFHHKWPGMPGLELGAGLEIGDSDFWSPEYYTPVNLISVKALSRYQRVFRGGSAVAADAGLGIAEDSLGGTRWVRNVAVRGTWMFRPNLGATVVLRFYDNPNYRSTSANLLLTWRMDGGLQKLGIFPAEAPDHDMP